MIRVKFRHARQPHFRYVRWKGDTSGYARHFESRKEAQAYINERYASGARHIEYRIEERP